MLSCSAIYKQTINNFIERYNNLFEMFILLVLQNANLNEDIK